MKRRRFLELAALGLSNALPVYAAQPPRIDVYKSPSCGCCGQWARHLEERGFKVTMHELRDLAAFRSKSGVPARLASCHTAIVDGYAIEGHVPAADIRRLIEQRPKARGLAVPGMPLGSPGMESKERQPYDVLLIEADGTTRVYARYHGS
jgi:hypothetical protein